jgi:hypothetical protein
MLKTLDVLIGLSVIMLALSMVVTLLVQFGTTIVNSRGRHLRRGLADLLAQLDPGLRASSEDQRQTTAASIATAVLTHPLISSTGRRLGSVVHREELTKLLLDLADDTSPLQRDAREALRLALARNGVPDPAATVKNIRAASLQIEASNPQLAASVRQTVAILQEARSDFTAKINNWFDQTMDRVAQRFTATTRAITFGSALLVAMVLQVDTIGLVNRLAADDMLRQAFVDQARAGQVPPPAEEGRPVQSGAAGGADTTEAMERQYLAFLAENGLIGIPRSPSHWMERWGVINLGGVLVTSLLLSLGAPFWYNALGRILQLRSLLAHKDDAQRQARALAVEAPVVGAVEVLPPLAGERGDPVAVG